MQTCVFSYTQMDYNVCEHTTSDMKTDRVSPLPGSINVNGEENEDNYHVRTGGGHTDSHHLRSHDLTQMVFNNRTIILL